MKQFEAASVTIRVLNNANKAYKEENDLLTTDKTLQDGLYEEQCLEIKKLKNLAEVDKQKVHDFEQEVDDMVKAIQRHDYKGCSCQVHLLPAVTNALNKKRVFKMGPRADGVVDRLRRSER